ncbi:hypothetical protein [Komagataeibacter sp. FNDCF1]|uniref:hypothetical protein n=1 Tax=Komagataeibacter sp. FNDCF1 TaxID=2878681 RepID=UPI001E3CC1E0|nr:hypothetical protein [Komagataeibacter sp. FNDCF1]MCE2564849.1 hypothetical protein [Komagataeibacter sp. FNDCF1]
MMTTGILLAGCDNKPAVNLGGIGGTPNPYNYMKPSGQCQVSTPAAAGKNTRTATMQVRSDDGYCAIETRVSAGHPYASFGVSPAPEHGKAFIYNYNDHTYVTYTANTSYSGEDKFRVVLIPGGSQPREYMDVTATVTASAVSGAQ